ncbi:MAG: DMT family transporter [Candidatus Micrarchaeota archaeon]|nr:DMT family transporter [Candidatus Micrarchaeota archaeon]
MDVFLGVLLAFLSAVLWAVSDFIIARIIKKGESPEKVFFYSQLIGTIALAIVYFAFFSNPADLTQDLIIMLLVAGFLNVISYLFFYKGIEKGDLSIISPLSSCWVIVTVVLGMLFLNEQVSILEGLGIIICVAGILLTSFRLKDLIIAKFMNPYNGANFAIMAALSWGILFIFIGMLNSRLGWFLPILIIRAVSLVFASMYMGATKKSISLNISLLPVLFFIAVFDAFAFVAYSLAISSSYTVMVAPVAATYPLIVILLARIFLKETLGLGQKIGIGLALLGVFLLLS